jgi:SAM-dependent methyltransferase
MNCFICNKNTEQILSLDNRFSVSSLGKVLEAQAKIYSCAYCSHCQTNPSIDLFEYYSNEYKTLSSSFTEDDLYEYKSGKPVYRNEHMAKTLIEKISVIDKLDEKSGAILDFGCGKSLMMKHLMEMTGKKNVYLYDVSEDYIKFWNSFVPQSHYACFELPEKWSGYFDLVTSSFSLEHVHDPLIELKKIKGLLKENGLVYIVVPNVYSANIMDMLVVDHIHHYSETSMKLLLERAGFEMVESDHESHVQGSIYIGRAIAQEQVHAPDEAGVRSFTGKCKDLAHFWNSFNNSIRSFEDEVISNGVNQYYIVGAGVLGTYVSLQFRHSEYLAGFIDSNKHKQAKGWQNKNVFAPGTISAGVSTAFFSGFNPDQVITILPGLLPPGVGEDRVWTINKVSNTVI